MTEEFERRTHVRTLHLRDAGTHEPPFVKTALADGSTESVECTFTLEEYQEMERTR